jgi:hypothetical protein
MQTFRATLFLLCILGCMCGSSFGQEMKEGGGSGGAHYCITRDTDTPTGSRIVFVAIRNTCDKDVAVIACGRLDGPPDPQNGFIGKVSCNGATLKRNAYVDPSECGWEVQDGNGRKIDWTFVWNAEYADSGIKPKSPMKNQATSGH